MLRTRVTAAAIAALVSVSSSGNNAAQSSGIVDHYRLVPGFIAESFNEEGMARGNGFATANPWGQYTAYLLATNGKGQRTWRIENYLPNQNGATAQGSSMYLFEGNARALLVDTAQNTQDIPGQNDLKTVVRHLLGHMNDGAPKPNPVDFVVSNTHSHGDHTGKNGTMSDRTVYYPDLDWPRNAPTNYVPIREGGGPSSNGPNGQAVRSIDLGERTIEAVRLYAHTPGSTGYLDRENRMVATGDAIGSAYVWAHFGSITQYADSVHHLRDVLGPFDHVDVLPAHFYQIKQGARGKPPINGRPLDKRYVDDQARVADAILNGTIVGDPYRTVGRQAAIASIDSAGVVYTLGSLYPGGVYASKGDQTKYHAIAIPGSNAPATATGRYAAVDGIKSTIHLIRDYANQTMYLISGSTKALLVGTGSGTPGVAGFVRGLAGKLPVEVILTSDDAGQIGGLGQFVAATVHVPRGMTAPAGVKNVRYVTGGDRIDLGTDRAGRPLVIEIQPLSGHSPHGITLIDVNNRALFSGDALGAQDNDAGLILREPLTSFANALTQWRAATDGKYDVVFTAHNFQWFTPAAFVDEVQAAVKKGLGEGEAAFIPSTRVPGARMIRSAGNAETVASIVLAN